MLLEFPIARSIGRPGEQTSKLFLLLLLLPVIGVRRARKIIRRANFVGGTAVGGFQLLALAAIAGAENSGACNVN